MKSTHEPTDTFGAIGSPIKPTPPAPAAPRPTGTPGILQGPDGKLSTNLPLPKAPAWVYKDDAGRVLFRIGGEPDDVYTADGVWLGGRE